MGAIPTHMTAIAIRTPGGPEVLEPVRIPVPAAAPGELLVRVAAAGINRPDILQRKGHYMPPPGTTPIPGLEVAGTVVALGSGTTRYRVGDHVCALVAGGGYAEYSAVPEPQALPIPNGITEVQAASLPETYFTVWANVFDQGAIKPGERLLVHGGSGGVGSAAIQIASALGHDVLATAGTEAKCVACRAFGARVAIPYRAGADFAGPVKAATGGEGVDVVLDCLGVPAMRQNLDVLKPRGRLAMIAFLEASRGEVELLPALFKRITLFGSVLRARSVAEKGALAAALEARVWPLLAAGRIVPPIDSTFPLAQAAQAQTRMEARAHVGKIVLTTGN